MADLVRTKRLLTVVSDVADPVRFEFHGPRGGYVLELPYADYDAFGKPVEITVTVEPGDRVVMD